MKIIVSDPRLGNFIWETSAGLDEAYAQFGQMLRQSLNIPEDKAVECEKSFTDALRERIQAFLLILTSINLAGPLGGQLYDTLDLDLKMLNERLQSIVDCEAIRRQKKEEL